MAEISLNKSTSCWCQTPSVMNNINLSECSDDDTQNNSNKNKAMITIFLLFLKPKHGL